MRDYQSLVDAAQANAQVLSQRLPAAHEDEAWLSNIKFRNDCNVRLTRNRFEEWMREAFLEGYKHRRRLKGEISLFIFELSRSHRVGPVIAASLLSTGAGLIALAFGYAPLLIGGGTLFVTIAALMFAKRV